MFSRGGALAREFANRVNDKYGSGANLRFMGLYDTVGSFGLPGNNINPGYRMKIPCEVDSVLHITAGNEYRDLFPLSSIRSGPDASLPDGWNEYEMPGAHSDIGGGYRDHRAIPNVTLNMMRNYATGQGVDFNPVPIEFQNRHYYKIHDSRYNKFDDTNTRNVFYY